MRTLIEIRELLEQQKEADLPELNEISSKAEYKLWLDLIATFSFNLEEIQELTRQEIEKRIIQNRIATKEWYVEIAKKFQLGDSISELENGNYGYAVLDIEKQIIAFAAVQDPALDTNFDIELKISKLDATLSNEENAQFTSYLEKMKIAGTKIKYISQDADVLDIVGEVYTDGLRTDAEITLDIQKALDAYYLQLGFNGELLVSEIVAQIKTVANVYDFYISSILATSAGNLPSAVLRSYISVSGKIKTQNLALTFFT